MGTLTGQLCFSDQVGASPALAETQQIDLDGPEPAYRRLSSRDEAGLTRSDTRVLPPRSAVGLARGAVLVQIHPLGPGLGACHPLGDAPLVIGRDGGCGFRTTEPTVSRQHARVEWGGDGHYVTDLGSCNGTFVDDAPAHRRRLDNGCYLRLGRLVFRFLAVGSAEAAYHREFYRLAAFDPLTEIPNRRHLEEFLDRELARAAPRRQPLAVVLFDVDGFKAINDGLGHLGGDHVLRELAACARAEVSPGELFARYGGEEFAVILPETDRDAAAARAERLRRRVEQHSFCYEGRRCRVTISLGVAVASEGEPATPQQLLGQADRNLYLAKTRGRNRVVARVDQSESPA